MIAEHIVSLLPKEWHAVVGDLPAAKNSVVGVMEYDGATSTEYFQMPSGGDSIFSPIVKIVCRNVSYTVGSQQVTAVSKLLHRYSDKKIMSSLLVGAPMYLGRTPEKLHEFQVTFKIQVRSD